MRRLPLLAAALLAVCVFAGGASAADSSGMHVKQSKGYKFPERAFVLSLPSQRKLTNGNVNVTENGGRNGPVLDLSVVPASEASNHAFGVVLLIDTSQSMAGKPLAAAMAAARAFAADRNPNEQLGVIEFNSSPTTAQNLTTSQAAISSSLSSTPAVAQGTHIYDAVAQGEAMLKAAKIDSGTIVVLSDGADTGSTKTIGQVGRAARNANLQIYTIGLEDKSYNASTLKELAASGDGQYAQATAANLPKLFDKLSRTISNEYVLQYKSPAGPREPVKVAVAVKGLGTASTSYVTPKLSAQASAQPFHRSVFDRIVSSPVTMVVLALLAAAAFAFLLIAILMPQRSGLPQRMSEFVSIRALQQDQGAPAAAEGDTDEEPVDDYWSGLAETLEIADIDISPQALVAGTIALTALVFVLIWAATGTVWWALLAFTIPYFSREWVLRTLARRRKRFAEQLPDALQVISSALRSGHSFAGALAVVVESSSEPMKSEMQRVVADEQKGVPIPGSLMVVAGRMASKDLEQLAMVAELQRESGGNAAEVIDRVAETVRERFDLRRLVDTLTMQGRMTRWIVSALPIAIVLILQLEDPHYLHPLVESTTGKIWLGLAVAWAVAGSFVIKRIVEIEV